MPKSTCACCGEEIPKETGHYNVGDARMICMACQSACTKKPWPSCPCSREAKVEKTSSGE